jgi:hypothetical protein
MAGVTPTPGIVSQITTGGTAVTVLPADINGGIITNPSTATEFLFVNAVTNASTTASGTTFGLAPGQSWNAIPGQTTVTTANAATDGHSFSALWW